MIMFLPDTFVNRLTFAHSTHMIKQYMQAKALWHRATRKAIYSGFRCGAAMLEKRLKGMCSESKFGMKMMCMSKFVGLSVTVTTSMGKTETLTPTESATLLWGSRDGAGDIAAQHEMFRVLTDTSESRDIFMDCLGEDDQHVPVCKSTTSRFPK